MSEQEPSQELETADETPTDVAAVLPQWRQNLLAWFALDVLDRESVTDPDLLARAPEQTDAEIPDLAEAARYLSAAQILKRQRKQRCGGKVMAHAFYQRYGILLGPNKDTTAGRAEQLCAWGEVLLEKDGLVPSKVERAAKIERLLTEVEDLARDAGEVARDKSNSKGMSDAAIVLLNVAKENALLGGNYAPVRTQAQIELESHTTVTYDPPPQAVKLGALFQAATAAAGAPAGALGAADDDEDIEDAELVEQIEQATAVIEGL